MEEFMDRVLESSPEFARLLCIGLALEAKKSKQNDLDYKTLTSIYRTILSSLNRSSFHDECRLLSRLGPERYLAEVAKKLIGNESS